jgi:hypothetical protein
MSGYFSDSLFGVQCIDSHIYSYNPSRKSSLFILYQRTHKLTNTTLHVTLGGLSSIQYCNCTALAFDLFLCPCCIFVLWACVMSIFCLCSSSPIFPCQCISPCPISCLFICLCSCPCHFICLLLFLSIYFSLSICPIAHVPAYLFLHVHLPVSLSVTYYTYNLL